MKIKTGFPVTKLSGKCANSQLVYFQLGSEIVARADVKPANPNTLNQSVVRSLRNDAGKLWDALSDESREGWEQWARKWSGVTGKKIAGGWPAGRNAYIAATQRRLMLKLPAGTTPPLPLPPPELLQAEELGTGEPQRFRFRIMAEVPPPTSGVVLPPVAAIVRITPPTLKRSIAPRQGNLRLIGGVNPASAAMLGSAAESVIEFINARYEVNAGQRFGFEVTPVRLEDGVSGKPLWVNCVRQG